MNRLFLEFLRWNLRLHGLYHLISILLDLYGSESPNWAGAFFHLYIVVIEILASFFIPKDHVHIRPIKSKVHDKCD